MGQYAQEANVGAIGAMATVARRFADLLANEEKAGTQLTAEAARWPRAANDFVEAANGMESQTRGLLTTWTSKDAPQKFAEIVDRSKRSLIDSATALDENKALGLRDLAELIMNMIGTVKVSAEQVAKEAEQLRDLQALTTAQDNPADLTAQIEAVRKALLTVGRNMDVISLYYLQFGNQAKSMAAATKWQGPHSDVSGDPRAGTGPGDPGRDPSGDPGAGPGAGPEQAAPGGPPGGAPGGAPGGGPGGAPGGAPGGQPGGAPGGGTGGPGTGPGLAGVPTLPKPLPPLTSLPPISPIDATPMPPVTPVAPLAPVARATPKPPGIGGLPGGGRPGIGGIGGIGNVGGIGGGGKVGGGIKPLDNLQQIPSVAKTGTETAVSTGRAPVLPGTGSGAGGGATAPASGVPPMMPPMGGAAGAAGGGRAGKPGSGAIRPTGRERSRTNGPTPGVPAGLRGKAGKKGSFATPAAKTPRRDREGPETLEILDEELWTVDTTPQKNNHRLAN